MRYTPPPTSSQQSLCGSSQTTTLHQLDFGPPPGHREVRCTPTATAGLCHWKSGPHPLPWAGTAQGSFSRKAKCPSPGKVTTKPPLIWPPTPRDQYCCSRRPCQPCRHSSAQAGTVDFSTYENKQTPVILFLSSGKRNLWPLLLLLFSRHRVSTTHLAHTDSEISLLQGELVLVHRPRPDGRLLITQESSGQTGLFHCSVLQDLERLSWLCSARRNYNSVPCF